MCQEGISSVKRMMPLLSLVFGIAAVNSYLLTALSSLHTSLYTLSLHGYFTKKCKIPQEIKGQHTEKYIKNQETANQLIPASVCLREGVAIDQGGYCAVGRRVSITAESRGRPQMIPFSEFLYLVNGTADLLSSKLKHLEIVSIIPFS